MIYSHYSEPGSRTGTRAPLENTAITAKAATSLRQPTRQWEFLPNLPSAELVRAHVGGYAVQGVSFAFGERRGPEDPAGGAFVGFVLNAERRSQ